MTQEDELMFEAKDTVKAGEDKGYSKLELDEVKVIDNQLAHKRKLMDLQGIKGWQRIKLDLLEAGFHFYITARELRRFKYFAVVRDSSAPSYIGDIPDFAIAQANLAISLGIREITIHSNQPLAIEYQKGDPVLIGWLSRPDEGVYNDFTCRYHENWEGVILAVWNNDKELEL